MRGGSPPGRTAGPTASRRWRELLARWDQGMVTGRRERRMAVRLAAERAALPDPPDMPAAGASARPKPQLHAGPAGVGCTVTTKTLRRSSMMPADGDFYADAFEILE